jgi:hypothetical protein
VFVLLDYPQNNNYQHNTSITSNICFTKLAQQSMLYFDPLSRPSLNLYLIGSGLTKHRDHLHQPALAALGVVAEDPQLEAVVVQEVEAGHLMSASEVGVECLTEATRPQDSRREDSCCP